MQTIFQIRLLSSLIAFKLGLIKIGLVNAKDY